MHRLEVEVEVEVEGCSEGGDSPVVCLVPLGKRPQAAAAHETRSDSLQAPPPSHHDKHTSFVLHLYYCRIAQPRFHHGN